MTDSDTSGLSEPVDVPGEPSADDAPATTAPRRNRRLGRRTVVVSVAALAVAAGGGAIAAAAGGHGGGGAAPGYGPGPAGYGGGPGGAGPLQHAIHGTFVVPSTSGSTTTYVTDVQQAGTVTALSATSITLKSPDGYTATYVMGSATKKDSAVAQGGQAVVVASGDPATALSVVVPRERPGPGAGGMRGPNGAPPSGAPSGQPSGAPGGGGV